MLLAALFGMIWLKDLGLFKLSDEDLRTIVGYRHHDNSVVYDNQGQKIGEYYSNHYIFVPYEKIPKALIDAIVAIEDRNFFEHPGFDARAIMRAAFSYLNPSSKLRQGGSTITQQLVRNFLLTRERTVERKLREIALAYLLEQKITKTRILEIYLNALFLGNGAYGVGSAAQRYFGRGLAELKPHELALIAGLFQSPSGYNPQKFPDRAKKRQIAVIRAMYEAKKISRKKAIQMAREPLNYEPFNMINLDTAPYFVDYVREQVQEVLGTRVKNRGLRIYTSLDAKLQRLAQETMRESTDVFQFGRLHLLNENARKNDQIESALLATDPNTGHILAMIGGRDYQTSQYNRAIQAKRSPGSAFKPIVYSLALSQGHKWSDMVYVGPVAIDDYRPRNHGNTYLTETTLLQAFYRSINTPVIELGLELGLDGVIEQAHKLGVESEIRSEGGSLLGASELSLLEMATVYSTFANGGRRIKPLAILKITNRKGEVLWEAPPIEQRQQKVISEQLSYLITEALRSVLKFGTAYSFREIAEFAVGKTGTSNQSRDNWLCGYSSKLTTIVWIGTDDPQGFGHDVAANKLALPIWARFMKKAAAIRPAPVPKPPELIVEEKINPSFGTLDQSGVTMYFFAGQAPTKQQSSFKVLTRSGVYRSVFDR